jgi:hypothetical protein
MPSSSARHNGERGFERRNYGQSVLRDILSLASSVGQTGKHLGAQKIFAVAEAARMFGEDLRDLPQLQAYAEAAAEGIDELGDYIDQTDIADILDDAATFAKRQPVITAAIAVAAGIAATQLIRNWRTIDTAGGPKPRSRGGAKRRGNGKRMH